MIASAVFVACLALVSAIPRRGTTQATNCGDPFQDIPNVCKNNPDNVIFLPHPTDNTKFLQCDLFGRMYVTQCPSGETFEAETTSCTTNTINVVTSAPSTAPTTKAPVATQAPVTSAPVNNPCTADNIAQGNLFFALSGSKTQFIECDQSGKLNVLNCPGDLVWEQSRLSCVYQSTVTSGTGSGTGTGSGSSGLNGVNNPCTAATLSTGELFFPHPDSHKFIQCDLWGDVFVNNCPTGLVWNDYSKTCASAFINIVNPDS